MKHGISGIKQKQILNIYSHYQQNMLDIYLDIIQHLFILHIQILSVMIIRKYLIVIVY
jgi:hypothetical protein